MENEVTKAVQPLVAKINHLEEENRSLFFKLDDLEQYGRRPMVRVSGIPESPNENTTEKIVTTLAKADIPLQSEDIIISHSVGKWSNSRDKPRQIMRNCDQLILSFTLWKTQKISGGMWKLVQWLSMRTSPNFGIRSCSLEGS